MDLFIRQLLAAICFAVCITNIICECNDVTCINGECVERNSGVSCVCDTGYRGVYCGIGVDQVFCAQAMEGGYEWPDTIAEGTARVSCNSSGSTNLLGIINRVCSAEGAWGTFDLTNCVNPAFELIQDKLNELRAIAPGNISLTSAMLLASSLASATNAPYNAVGAFVSPANLVNAVDSLEILQRSIKEKYGSSKAEAIDGFAVNWFKSCSNVLDARNLPSYMSPTVDALTLTNRLVDSLDGISNDFGGSATIERAITEPNIIALAGPIPAPSQGVALFPSTMSMRDGEFIKIHSETIDALKMQQGGSVPRIGMTVSKELGRVVDIAMNAGSNAPRSIPKFITLAVGGSTGRLEFKDPISISFKASAEDWALTNSGGFSEKCGYWNVQEGEWAFDGLSTVRENPNYFTCQVSHFTSFSVLIKPNPIGNDTSVAEQIALSAVTYILCIISLIALIISITVFLLLGKELFKKDLYMVHLNFAIALAVSLCFFVFGVQTAKDSAIACGVIAGILHYSFLSVFSWSLCEVILVLYMLFVLFTPKRIYPFLMVVGWGLPVPIVAITVGIRWYNYGVEGEYCWLSTENGTVWSFIGPALTVVFINMILLVVAVVRILMGMRAQMRNMTRLKQARTAAFGSFVLVPILGIPWIVAVLNFFVSVSFFQWIFVILNTPQGLLFFLLYVLNNRDLLKKVFCRKRMSVSNNDSVRERGSDFSPKHSRIEKFKKQSIHSRKSEIEIFGPESPKEEKELRLAVIEETNVGNEASLGIENPSVSPAPDSKQQL